MREDDVHGQHLQNNEQFHRSPNDDGKLVSANVRTLLSAVGNITGLQLEIKCLVLYLTVSRGGIETNTPIHSSQIAQHNTSILLHISSAMAATSTFCHTSSAAGNKRHVNCWHGNDNEIKAFRGIKC